MLGANQAVMLGLSRGGFVDPRAAKTNLLNSPLSTSLSAVTDTGEIYIGPDGVTVDGRRWTSTGGNSFGVFLGSNQAGPALYTASAYVRTPSDQAMGFGIGDGAALNWSPLVVAVPYLGGAYAGWTLVEKEASNTALRTAHFWFGAGFTFTTGEWVEIARPMIYAGSKVS